MIKLEVEGYCQECSKFKPIKKEMFYANNRVYETIIRCEHKEMCEEIAEHIEQTQKKWI